MAARTRAQLSRIGFRPKKGEEPHGSRYLGWVGWCDVWRRDQVEPKRRQKPGIARELTVENVLAALFTLNRRAKRARDLASIYYNNRMFGFASLMREEKENIYEIKDNAICFALSQSWLEPVGAHGDFTIYRGGGYCFHSLIRPQRQEPGEAEPDEPGKAENLFVESKPREAAEMRLADALATLQALPETDLPEGFDRWDGGGGDDENYEDDENENENEDEDDDDFWY